MDRTKAWLWFTLKRSLTIKEQAALIEIYKTPEAIYYEKSYADIELRSECRLELMDKSMKPVDMVLRRIDSCGAYIITIDDENYPPLLRETYDAPYVLYAIGKCPDWNEIFTFTVVGTRKCTTYGRDITRILVSNLVHRGAVIVSGLARGVDTVANATAINCGGTTIGVLGCGIDRVYPMENFELFECVKQTGLLITEYPPGTGPVGSNFPRRNRIMAGLSYGVLVTEAPEKSGALITADLALDYNRDVFAVPSGILLSAGNGCNRLIQHGAKLVINADDILCEYTNLLST